MVHVLLSNFLQINSVKMHANLDSCALFDRLVVIQHFRNFLFFVSHVSVQ